MIGKKLNSKKKNYNLQVNEEIMNRTNIKDQDQDITNNFSIFGHSLFILLATPFKYSQVVFW